MEEENQSGDYHQRMTALVFLHSQADHHHICVTALMLILRV